MSVINTMLKDLEQRGGKRDQSKEDVLQGLSSSTTGIFHERNFNPYLVSLFSVLGVCVILMLVYLYSPYRLVDAQQVAQPAGAAVTATRAAGIDSDINVASAEIGKVVPRPAAVVAVAEKRATSPQPAATTTSLAPAKKTPDPDATLPTTRAESTQIATADATSTVRRNHVKQANTATADRVESADSRSAIPTASITEDETDAAISKTKREPGKIEKSENTYRHAMDLFSQGRTDEARLQLKQALGLEPANSKATQLLAAIYLGDNRSELAVDVLDKGLKLRPADQDLLRLYLQVQVQMKNYTQAIDIMERRMRLNTPEEVAYLAGLHQKNNDHLGAARLYAQALKLVPSNSVWWMGQGISFEALGMNEEAMKSYRQSIESGRLNTQLTEYVLGRIASIEKSARDPVS